MLTIGGEPRTSADSERQRVAAEVLDELMSLGPRERHLEFRTWLAGSLSLVHLHVLNVLETDGPLSMSHLAEALDVSVASATGIVDRMEGRGLVERGRQEGDRRVIVVHRTPAGEAVFSDLAHHRRKRLTRLLVELSDEELGATLVVLRAIRRARAVVLAEHEATNPDEAGAGQ